MSDATEAQRIEPLATHEGYDPADYEMTGEAGNYGRGEVIAGGVGEWIVLTDAEADEAAATYVEDSLWAFNAKYLAEWTGLPVRVFEALSDMCEDSNDTIRQLIEAKGTLEDFTCDAINTDGRGHFLSGWDGQEIELESSAGRLYAYRVN